jgi:hypothetical protein
MIDWLEVLYQLLWILGLGLILTTASLAHWMAEQGAQSMGQLLARPAWRLAMAVGLGLFGLGAALLVEPWWYKIGWLGVIMVSFWRGQTAWRSHANRLKQD